MISRRPSPFDVIARVLAERLRAASHPKSFGPSCTIEASIEHVVGYASGDLVLPALPPLPPIWG